MHEFVGAGRLPSANPATPATPALVFHQCVQEQLLSWPSFTESINLSCQRRQTAALEIISPP